MTLLSHSIEGCISSPESRSKPVLSTQGSFGPRIISHRSQMHFLTKFRAALMAAIAGLIMMLFRIGVTGPTDKMSRDMFTFRSDPLVIVPPPLDLSIDYEADRYVTDIPRLSECLEDWIAMGLGDGREALPPLVPDGIVVPFYVFPDPLPKQMAWSECYLQTGIPTYVKRQSSYYIAKQLENHPWRVYTPEEALLFVMPWLDPGTDDLSAVPEDCHAILAPTATALDQLDRAANEHEYLQGHNMVMFIGFYRMRAAWGKWRIKYSKNHGRDPWWLPGAFTPTFTPAIIRYEHFAYQMNMSGGVDEAICFPADIEIATDFGSMEDRLAYCDRLHAELEADFLLPLDEWKIKRFLRYESMGRFDDRRAYNARKLVAYSYFQLFENGNLPDEVVPSFILYKDQYAEDHGKVTQTKGNGDTGKAPDCQRLLDPLIAKHDLHSDGGVVCGGNTPREWKEKVGDYVDIDFDVKKKAQMALSLRGDSLGSQRSLEGMMYGSLTWHDNSAFLIGMSVLPLPNHIPWRLTGAFDDNFCVTKLHKRYQSEILSKFKISAGVRTVNEDATKNLKPEQIEELEAIAAKMESELVNCTTNLPRLIDGRPEVADLMRSVIQFYRDDVLFETPNSRAAQALLFEAASYMKPSALKPFNLTPEMLSSQVPTSCTTETAHTLAHLRSLGSKHQRRTYLNTLGDYDEITGALGKNLYGGF